MMRAIFTRRRLVAASLVVGTGCSLAACGSDEGAELANTQWQVTQVSSGGTVSNATDDTQNSGTYLADSQAGRVFFVFSDGKLRGASGCVDLTADLDWGKDSNTETVSTSNVKSIENPDVSCLPNDTTTAEKLVSTLSDKTFTWSRPDSHSLRLTATQFPADGIHTAPFVEFISGSSTDQ